MIEEHHFEDEINEDFLIYNKLLINHESAMFLTFNWLYVILCLFTSYWYGFISLFNLKTENEYFYPIYITIEIFFAIKIILMFFVTFENPRQKNQMIKKFDQIAWRYIKSVDFLIDFIAIVPL
jgi:hypothetical protein